MVSALIDEKSRGWNFDLIKTSFLPHEANVILGIPLSPMALKDSQVCTKTPNGIFTRDGNFYPIRGYPVRPDPNGPDFTRSDKE